MASFQPTELQLDALREFANIGSGQAVSALSALLGGRRVELGLSNALVPADAAGLSRLVGWEARTLVAIVLDFEGAFRGRFVLALEGEDAGALAAQLTGRERARAFDALDESALSEAANILASATLNAASSLLRGPLLPSTPIFRAGTVSESLAHVLRDFPGALALSTRFWSEGQGPLRGAIVAIPRVDALPGLLSRLGV